MTKKRRIAIDLDDTIATTTKSLIAHIQKTRGTVMDLGDISSDSFKDLVFVGNPYISQEFRSKAEVCAERGIFVVVDDNPSHVVACAKAGLRSLHFGGYPWHKQVPSNDLVESVLDWAEVERRLL